MIGRTELGVDRLDVREHLVAAPVTQTQLLSARRRAQRDEQIVSA